MTSSISEFPVTPGSFPLGITAGPDGDLWFTQLMNNQIGEIDPVMHGVTEYTLPTPKSAPMGITTGPDHNVWFTEFAGNKIGTINSTTHAISEYVIPTANSLPGFIAAGPDGNLWFTEATGNKIARINPTTHAITEFLVPTANSQPAQIVVGPDGNLWFTEDNTNQIGEFNLTTHHIAEIQTPTANSQPLGLTAGPDGNLWFTENNSLNIGSINPMTHHITEYPIPIAPMPNSPLPNSRLFAITVGPDGNLWFTEEQNQIGEFNLTTHAVTEVALKVYSIPGFIIAGQYGTVWFTDCSAGQIGEIQVTPMTGSWLQPQSVEVGQTVTFTASAIGTPTPTVQWQVLTPGSSNFTPLSDGGIYSGVTTDTLTITNVTLAQNNCQYRAVFSNGNAKTNAITIAGSLSVSPALRITSGLPQGKAGVSYHQTITVSGGILPPTITVTNFNAGGTGLKASAITINPFQYMPTLQPGTITINGTPTAAGTATFTVHVTDSAGGTLTQTYRIVITSTPTFSNLTPSQWTAGKPGFTGTMTISGGSGPFYLVSSTGLPKGLTAVLIGRTIRFNGVPSLAGTFANGRITISDGSGASVVKVLSITINPPLPITV